ncbi:MAG: D-alanyl-D-alanine carboxypeptidase/D-alanyl-D-alanine-endopeptidase [Gemmatimonadetes bacterium]|nr:D-alanyl-D-alanine carboxypeptidase/D-alanyl-D-alanine-endopeptidase [Gemmatimonadota bacterium]
MVPESLIRPLAALLILGCLAASPPVRALAQESPRDPLPAAPTPQPKATGAAKAPEPGAAATKGTPSASATKAGARPKAKPGPKTRRGRKARGPAPIPSRGAWANPVGAAALTDMLATTIPGPVTGTFSAMVVSLSRGDTLFAHAAGTPVMPASTMKLFTSALALEVLGPQHRFATEVLRDGVLAPDGTLRGNLVLRGDGDPSLSPRLLGGAPGDPMARLARDIAAAGVKRVTGDVIADGSAFDDSKIPEGWRKRYLGAAYAARVSALSLNENLIWIVVKPGAKGASVTTDPPTAGLPIESEVRVVPGRGGRISAWRRPDGSIKVKGSIGAAASERRWSLVVEDPALFAAGALHAQLEALGVNVAGKVRAGRASPVAPRLAVLASPPLKEIVAAMNGESINLFAELLFRSSARGPARAGVGNAVTANNALERFLSGKVGVDSGAVNASDGSGLSILDRVTARSLVKLLAYGHRAPWSAEYHASLPVAGESETLRHRMRRTPAQGNLHAKTGTTNDVVSLAGYVTAKNGELLAFAMVYNGHDKWRARERIDRVGATLAAFTRE